MKTRNKIIFQGVEFNLEIEACSECIITALPSWNTLYLSYVIDLMNKFNK